MSINEQKFGNRLRAGKQEEEKILKILNETQPWLLTEWKASSVKEDIEKKIDAWASDFLRLKIFSVQIKYRDSGMDLGIALLRPWEGIAKFRKDYELSKLKFDRDYVAGVDLYVCMAGNRLILSNCDAVHMFCQRALAHLYETGFFVHEDNDWQLKAVTDADNGQRKLICYIPFHSLLREGAYMKVCLDE